MSNNRRTHFLALGLLLVLPVLSLLSSPLFRSFAMRLDQAAFDSLALAPGKQSELPSTIIDLANSTAPPSPLLPIVAVDSNRQLVDSAGQTRLFRGMGICYKAHPFIPLTDRFDPVLSFADADIATFQRLGLNVIRLSVPWVAVEPEEGHYDEEYLAKIIQLIKKCSDAGIFVLIEAHQDLYSARFMGNGMPAWSITKDRFTMAFPRPVGFTKAKYTDETGPPTNVEAGDDWGRLHAADECTRAFFGLYTDERIQSAFVRYWEKLASTFKGIDNILGYEILNEPFVASRSAAGVLLALLDRASTEKHHLQKLYDRVAVAIRKIDSRTLIFYEPCTGGGGNSGTGFKSVPGGDESRSVMSFHSYGPNMVDGHTMQVAIEKRVKQVEHRLGGSLMLTEWDCEYARGLGRIQEVMELCDESLVSWIGWQYKEFIHITGSPPSGTLYDPKTSKLRPEMLKLFSRPFPSSIAGVLKSFSFDWKRHILTLSYIPVVGGSTHIYLNDEAECGWQPWELRVKGESVGVVASREKTGIVVMASEKWKSESGILSLEIRPASL